MKIDNIYKTDSITISSFILCHPEDVELLGVQEDKFHHFFFVLSSPEKCEELRRQYLNGASAPAMELFSKREMLLGEIKAKSNRNTKGGKFNE